MRVESPFSEKSSARPILTRARGLGFLTFDKIRKKVFIPNLRQCDFGCRGILSFCQNRRIPQKTMSKKFFMGFSSVSSKTLSVPVLVLK